jgi:hypothetical protein
MKTLICPLVALVLAGCAAAPAPSLPDLGRAAAQRPAIKVDDSWRAAGARSLFERLAHSTLRFARERLAAARSTPVRARLSRPWSLALGFLRRVWRVLGAGNLPPESWWRI